MSPRSSVAGVEAHLADIVNLRTARKHKARAEKQARSEANRVRHGRSRAERQTAETENEVRLRRLDGHRRETDDPGKPD